MTNRDMDELREYGSAIGGRIAVAIGEVTSILKSIHAKVCDALACNSKPTKTDSTEESKE